MSNEPTNKEMFNMNSVKATPDSVGEWEGQEQKAADNINRIQDALYEAAPDEYDNDQLHDIMKAAWDNWGNEEALLTVTDAQIKAYVSKVMYKVIRITLPTYGYLMDHRTLYLKSMDSVIWDMIEDRTKSEAKIKELEAVIAEMTETEDDRTLILMESYLDEVRTEALTYKNVTKEDVEEFETAIWDILEDPNTPKDACIYEDDVWYICLADGESSLIGAENFALTLQDEKSIVDFAANVIRGK